LQSQEPVQLAPGDVLARKYRLIEPLGEGGMAVVWVALNIALETRVAIKILRAALASDARLVARIRQEAKATAAIAHKNIVQVYDYGVTGWGAPFIVMELLHGETLAERMKSQGRLAPVDAVRTLMRAMKGITVAHAKGIVHRDLKPENIFLAVEDNGAERPKVLDFGVSFVARESGDDRLTRAGGIVGTPSYLPPEAIEGDNRGDVRGDVWALGVMLHETITGDLPFHGKTVHALLEAIVHEPAPPMGDLVPNVDPRLQQIVDRALAKDPARRHPGVRELFDELNVWLGGQEHRVSLPALTSASPSSPSSPTPHPLPLGLPSDPLQDDEQPTLVGPSLEPGPGGFPSASLLPLSRSQSVPSARRERRSSNPPASWRSGTTGQVPHARGLQAGAAPWSRRAIGLAASSATLLVVALGTGGFLLASRQGAIRAQAAGQASSAVALESPALASASGAASPGSASSAAAPSSGAAPQAPLTIVGPSIDVQGLPDKALVRVNGDRIGKLPWPLAKAGKVLVRVDAPNYAPWLIDVVVEGPVVLTFSGQFSKRDAPSPTGIPGVDYKNVPY
jgi:eukaryotic-like serine/threonine-protein kinase